MNRYDNYIESDSDWPRQIPSRWAVKDLKRITNFAYGDSLKDEDREKDGDVPVFGSNGQVGNHSIANTEAPTIIIGRKGSYGKVTYCNTSAFAIDTTYFVDRTVTNQNLRWLYYVLESLDLDGFTQDSAVPGLSREFAYSKKVPVPSAEEQSSIANYLDNETARIDQLIANKRQQIKKLDELRQITISRAVTRGLDPSALMKDSGVIWLGEVPAHWRLSRIKSLGHFIGGETPSKDNKNYWNGDIPWVSPKDMKKEVISETEDYITDDAIRDSTTQVIPIGAMLLVVRSGILKHSIPVAINSVPVTLNQDMKAFIPRNQLYTQYLAFLIRGCAKDLLVEWRKLGATVESLEYDLITNTKIPVPSIEEQRDIIRFLEKEADKFGELINNINSQIEKLEELRKITINDAVTGKVKVTD